MFSLQHNYFNWQNKLAYRVTEQIYEAWKRGNLRNFADSFAFSKIKKNQFSLTKKKSSQFRQVEDLKQSWNLSQEHLCAKLKLNSCSYIKHRHASLKIFTQHRLNSAKYQTKKRKKHFALHIYPKNYFKNSNSNFPIGFSF